MSKHKIVIVGGGFGGVKAALELASDRRFHITLISDHSDFRIYGTLYHTATGGTREIASIPLTEIFAGKRVHLIQDKAVSLDRKERLLITAVGHKIPYDALVLAMGVLTNYFHIKGLSEYSYGIKTPDDADELKRHLHQQMIDEKRPDLDYVVIGGGPTGIELAGALPAYLKKVSAQHGIRHRAIHVDLVEAAPRLVPRMPKIMSRRIARHLRKTGVHIHLKKMVQAQTADSLMVDNKPIRSHTVIWTAGVTNHPFFSGQAFQLAPNGKVRVDQYLQHEPGIYVIGDNADTPYSGMAQVALSDGKYVAGNLIRLANELEPVPYKAKKPIYVLPAGPKWAAVLWGPVQIYGRPGWWLRRLADLVAYHDYEPWQLAAKRWIAEADEEEPCIHCGDKFNRMLYESGEL
jgi:NADH:ubiquinone reductase (H+-translocating)